jgi:hypothetical protein
MWGDEEGMTTAQMFAKNRLFFQRERGDRENGWQRLREWFCDMSDHVPAMLINPAGCPTLARTLPDFVKDPKNPEDIDETASEPAGANALRFLVMSRPAPLSQSTAKVYPPGSAGAMREQLIRNHSSAVLGRHNVR